MACTSRKSMAKSFGLPSGLFVYEGMRHLVPWRWAGIPVRPMGISAANCCRRARIGVKTQFNQRRCAPFAPVSEAGGGQPVFPQPGHCRTCKSSIVIPRASDYGNGHFPRYTAPILPVVKLGQIVSAHQPYKTALGIAALDGSKRVYCEARAQLLLDRGNADFCIPAGSLCRFHSPGERGHALFRLKRVSGRDQPPRLIQPQCVDGKQRHPSVPAMRRIEAASKKASDFTSLVQERACPEPKTCHL